MKSSIIFIPTLCLCGCNEVVWKKDWRNREYINGHNRPWIGKHRSEDTKEKMSSTMFKSGLIPCNKGKHWNEETRKKMKESRKIALQSEEYIKKLSEKGKNAYFATMRSIGYIYSGEMFLSKQELLCFKLLEGLGLKNKVDFFHDFEIKNKKIDFYFPKQKLFWEYHPDLPWDKRTPEEYELQRREILNKNGYIDHNLIVTQNMKEFSIIKGELQ